LINPSNTNNFIFPPQQAFRIPSAFHQFKIPVSPEILAKARNSLKNLQVNPSIAGSKQNLFQFSTEDVTAIAKEIEQRGGEDSLFKRDLEKVLTFAGLKNPQNVPLSELGKASFGAVENAVSLLKSEDSDRLLRTWENARTTTATSANIASSFYRKYSTGDDLLLNAKTVLSPDGTSVTKLSAEKLSLPLLGGTPQDDMKQRLLDIQNLAGISRPDVTLQIDRERNTLQQVKGTGIFLRYVARIGELEIPFRSIDYWGFVSYENLKFQNVEFNRPLVVKELPQAGFPLINRAEVLRLVRERLAELSPSTEKMKCRLELTLDPNDKSAGRWVPAYRVDLPLPSGRAYSLYVDAKTGLGIE
jgi:hypothetical protein